MKKWCDCCGGRGKILVDKRGWIPCPVCGSVVVEKDENDEPIVAESTNPSVKEQYDKLEVPKVYQTMKYSSEFVFWGNSKSSRLYQVETLKNLASVCDRIYSSIYNGEVMLQSVYLFIPSVFDSNIFVFDTQKLAISRGFTVSRYVTLNELLDIIGKPEYKDFYTSQVCFLDASARTTESAWVALADILAIRARKGLCTYVTGYWASTSLERTGASYIIDEDSNRLNLLNPVNVISVRRNKNNNGGNFEPVDSSEESIKMEDMIKFL